MYNKCSRILTAAALAAALLAATVDAQPAHPVERYEVVHGWPELPPGEILGQATGVDVDSTGNVWVFHRAGRTWQEPFPADPIQGTTVWMFEARTGRLLKSWGAGLFIMPHGLTIDRDDNVWLTDVGLQQVFKFSPDGRLLMALGEPRVAGNDDTHFDQPTDVAIAADRSFFVSDGYGNSRVLHFSADGKLLKTWGTKGAGPGEFNLPHGIAIDERGRVLVADRSNARVQVFDTSGTFLDQWQGVQLGRPYAAAVGQKHRVFIADGGDQPKTPPDRGGVAVVDTDGQLIIRFGRFGNPAGSDVPGPGADGDSVAKHRLAKAPTRDIARRAERGTAHRASLRQAKLGVGRRGLISVAALRPRRPHFADAQFGSGGEPR